VYINVQYNIDVTMTRGMMSSNVQQVRSVVSLCMRVQCFVYIHFRCCSFGFSPAQSSNLSYHRSLISSQTAEFIVHCPQDAAATKASKKEQPYRFNLSPDSLQVRCARVCWIVFRFVLFVLFVCFIRCSQLQSLIANLIIADRMW
jgi:DNA phosphorothioation-dependent restriction protein DptG